MRNINKNIPLRALLLTGILSLMFILPYCVHKGTYPYTNPTEIQENEKELLWKVDFGYYYTECNPIFYFLIVFDPPYKEIFNLYLYKKENQEWRRWLKLENLVSINHKGDDRDATTNISSLIWFKDNYIYVNSCIGYIKRKYGFEKYEMSYAINKIYKIDLTRKKVVDTTKFAFLFGDLNFNNSIILLKSNRYWAFLTYSSSYNKISVTYNIFKLLIIQEDLSRKVKCYKVLDAEVAFSMSEYERKWMYNAQMPDDDTINIKWVDTKEKYNERTIKISDLKEENCAVE